MPLKHLLLPEFIRKGKEDSALMVLLNGVVTISHLPRLPESVPVSGRLLCFICIGESDEQSGAFDLQCLNYSLRRLRLLLLQLFDSLLSLKLRAALPEPLHSPFA